MVSAAGGTSQAFSPISPTIPSVTQGWKPKQTLLLPDLSPDELSLHLDATPAAAQEPLSPVVYAVNLPPEYLLCASHCAEGCAMSETLQLTLEQH